MLDINLIRNEPEALKTALRNRQNPDLVTVVDEILGGSRCAFDALPCPRSRAPLP